MVILIRGIWGAGRGHSDLNLEKTVRESKENDDPVDKVYCYGEENKRMLERCGFFPEMLDSHPWPHGISHWHCKLKMIERALQGHGSILWQDFDVRRNCDNRLPSDYWEVMESGSKVRACLVVTRSPSRGAVGRDFQEARLVPAGGFLYVRGLAAIREILTIQRHHPRWDDQAALTRYMDQLPGGWVDSVHYNRAGRNVEGYYYGGAMYRPAPEDTYWICGPRKTQSYARWFRERWEEPKVTLTISGNGPALNMRI